MGVSEPGLELDSAVHKALLESRRAIPRKVDWASARFAPIGLQVEGPHGLSQDSVQDV